MEGTDTTSSADATRKQLCGSYIQMQTWLAHVLGVQERHCWCMLASSTEAKLATTDNEKAQTWRRHRHTTHVLHCLTDHAVAVAWDHHLHGKSGPQHAKVGVPYAAPDVDNRWVAHSQEFCGLPTKDIATRQQGTHLALSLHQ